MNEVCTIASLNWCKYVLERLKHATVLYKNSLYTKSSRGHYSGCIILFELIYFHHLQIGDGLPPTCLTLLSHWDNVSIRIKIHFEVGCEKFGSDLLDDSYSISAKLLLQ